VTGFSGPAVRLLELGASLRWLTGGAVEPFEGAWRLSFAGVPGRRYLAVGPGGLVAPASLRPWKTLARGGAQYLVVAPPALLPAARRLAQLRQEQGLAARAVDAEAIGDAFGGGVVTPQAIATFVRTVRGERRLRYVALLGTGTLDYRDLLGHGDNVLPPLMARTPDGLFPADLRLGDTDGDGLPDAAVGRITVLDLAAAHAWVDRLAAYEAQAEPQWAGQALLLADADDAGVSFTADGERVAAQLPEGYEAARVTLATEPLAAARERLFLALDEGVAVANYLGHGGLDRLAAGGLLTSADVATLDNAGRLPVLTAMTCTVNRFAVPGVAALGELLVVAPQGGAIAVLGPSGVAPNADSRALAEAFYRLLGSLGPDSSSPRLGDLALRAALEAVARGADAALLDLYNLLGDPATRLPVPPAPAPVPSGGTGE
jgi:hypothetical protein